ncbi:MAG: acyltransferase family protein [Romboutsia sp.]|nr:acyltransferase family protein [Romboutsia sp.]
MDKRDVNLDLLRVICCIMVIALHVGTMYGSGIYLKLPVYYFTIGNFFHSVTRIAVPIFIMISGAFTLNNTKNMNYKYYYKKILKKIIIPTLIYSVIYVLFEMCMGTIYSSLRGEEFNYFKPILNWIKGEPYFHLWYMYMIIGCYIITPILIKIRILIGDAKLGMLGWIFMFLGMAINLAGINLIWPLQFIQFLGYFILGYFLKYNNKLTRASSLPLLITSIILLLNIFVLTEVNIRYNLTPDKFCYLKELSPMIIASSICMYISFLNMRPLKLKISNLASHTFNIYLIHAGILKLIEFIVREILKETPNPIWYNSILTIFVFIISYWISLILSKINKKYIR